MSTKKKTTTPKTTKTKRSTSWQLYFQAAITGLAANPTMLAGGPGDTYDETEMTHACADVIRQAEKLATIADGRNV